MHFYGSISNKMLVEDEAGFCKYVVDDVFRLKQIIEKRQNFKESCYFCRI